MRRLVLRALSAVTVMVTPLSAVHADDTKVGFGANASYAAVVHTEVTGGVGRESTFAGVGYRVGVACTFAGVLTPNNRLQVAFGGAATSSGPQLPQLTYLKCSVSNEDAQNDSSEFANGGPNSQTFKTTTAWRVSPVTVCAEGFTVFGPTPVTIITVAATCKVPDL